MPPPTRTSVPAPTPAPTPKRPARNSVPAPASRVSAPRATVPVEPAGGAPSVRINGATPQAGSSSGDPLPVEMRTRLEHSFNADFRDVRVHTDTQAQKTVRNLSARAFTVGRDIYLAPGEQPTDSRLLAHELAHVVQQGRVPRLQKWSLFGESDRHEREAHSAATAVAQGQSFTVREFTGGTIVQRWGIRDALDYIADAANNIPGFSMLTFVIGVNPINMRAVERNATNLFRAIIGFMPGGDLIFRALQNHGIVDRVGNWIQQQLRSLGIVGSALKNALDRFLDSLSWRDIFDLGGVWNRAKRIFTEPINRLISFIGGLVSDIITFIRDAILRPVARLAEGTRGYDLLRFVLGRDPITGDPYPRTPENLIGGFMRLIGQEEKWRYLQQSRAIPRAWAWFQAQLGALMGFVSQIPQLFLQLWNLLEITDLLNIGSAFNKIRSVFGGFISNFISWAGNAALQIMMFIFEVLVPGAMPVLRRAASVIRTIISNPVAFVRNLVRAGAQGFRQFATNIRTHLINGLVGWITGTLSGAGITLPARWDLRGILSLVLQILGLTWANIRQKLVRVMGETAVRVLETGFQLVVTLVREGPAAAWQQILQHVRNLQEMVMGGIRDWVVRTVVQQAVIRIASMLNPAGAVIQAILAIYNTIMFFRERLQQIIQVAEAFFNSIASIARGNIAGAANYVERTMARLVPVVISFLARLLGLGGISDTIRNIINRIRAPIDRAIDRVIEWIKNAASSLVSRAAGGDPNATPQQRLRSAVAEAKTAMNRYAGQRIGAIVLRPLLGVIKVRNRLTSLDVVERGENWAVRAVINPTYEDGTNVKVDVGNTNDWPTGSGSDPIPIKWFKRTSFYPSIRMGGSDHSPSSGITLPAIPGFTARTISATSSNFLGDGDTTGRQPRGNESVKARVGEHLRELGRLPASDPKHIEVIGVGTDYQIDHIRDLTWKGHDVETNLWPYRTSLNRGANASHNQRVRVKLGSSVVTAVARDSRFSSKTFIIKKVATSAPASSSDHETDNEHPINSGLGSIPKKI